MDDLEARNTNLDFLAPIMLCLKKEKEIVYRLIPYKNENQRLKEIFRSLKTTYDRTPYTDENHELMTSVMYVLEAVERLEKKE